MGKLIALSTLMSDIRDRYDMDPSNSRLTDARLTRLINASRDRLSSILVDTDETFLESDATLTTTAGVDFVSLPARFHALTALSLEIDNCRVPLRRATADEIGGPLLATTWNERRPVYRLSQGIIKLWPVPDGAYPLLCTYLAGSFEDLVLATDTWDAHPSWVEWVTLDVLIPIRTKDRSFEDVRILTQLRDMCEEKVRASIVGQDRNGPPMIRRVADGEAYSGRRLDWRHE